MFGFCFFFNLGGTTRFIMKSNSFLLCSYLPLILPLETTTFKYFSSLLVSTFVLLNKILVLPLLDFLVLGQLSLVMEDEDFMIS